MMVRLRLCRRIGRFIFNRLLMPLSGNNLLRGMFNGADVWLIVRILQVRTMLYELLTHCIPPTTILKVRSFLV